MDTINTFTVSSFIQTSCESSVDACSKEARWNSLLSSNSLLQTTQRCSLHNSALCCLTPCCFLQLTTLITAVETINVNSYNCNTYFVTSVVSIELFFNL